MDVYFFLMLLVSSVGLSVGVCILLHRPDYAEPINNIERALVIMFWWVILGIVQYRNLKERMGW